MSETKVVEGSRWDGEARQWVKDCPLCHGSGKLKASDLIKGEDFVFIQDDMGDCHACNGKGKVPS